MSNTELENEHKDRDEGEVGMERMRYFNDC
jgi:hypothetical protein